ncbi:flagellar hook-associated protein FlgK [Bacillus alkalisoli]|uniref:flagellar hook-associated protein FlgK n=1 Tax=Bacillus alkalisoli TaxID=2011008 RepID=UPI000C23AB98|nr:flagellar hook-associated protein FlgK [Bacillus alkalisoli]
MRSTFHSLEVARRGLTTQQTALQVTGHNIANANTPGFSRQRVNFVQTEPYPPASMNRPQIPGQLGTGVQAGSIQRVRESFLDIQFRGENNKHGYWTARADSLQKMEEIMNEPSETGLSKTLDRFWQSFQDLAVNPTNSGARSVVRQRGIAVADTFNYLSNSIQSIQQDLKNELDVTAKQINSISNRINNLNKQISEVEPHGLLPNDLYDERDRLVDELSQLVNIKVTRVGSGGNAMEIAEGKYTIEIVDDKGFPTGINGVIVDGNSFRTRPISLDFDDKTGLVRDIKIGDVGITVSQFSSSGKFKGLIESYGYMVGNESKGIYPDMNKHLDTIAYDFIAELNRVHNASWSNSSMDAGEHITFNFFEPLNAREGAASNISLDAAIMTSLDNIAASTFNNGLVVDGTFNGFGNLTNVSVEILTMKNPTTNQLEYKYKINDRSTNPVTNVFESNNFQSFDNLITNLENNPGFTGSTPPTNLNLNAASIDFTRVKEGDKWSFNLVEKGPVKGNLGDGSGAIALAEVKNRPLSIGGVTTTIQNYYESVIGGMAVDAQEADRLSYNSEVLKSSVDQRRQSISSVSLDEEMTNMIQFQHAYNASARMITLTDELLDRIINGMGLAGR